MRLSPVGRKTTSTLQSLTMNVILSETLNKLTATLKVSFARIFEMILPLEVLMTVVTVLPAIVAIPLTKSAFSISFDRLLATSCCHFIIIMQVQVKEESSGKFQEINSTSKVAQNII